MHEHVPPLVRDLPEDTVLRQMVEAPAPGYLAYYRNGGPPPG